jgi:hypothetical protein
VLNQVEYQVVVTARCRMMNGCVATMIPHIDVHPDFFDQELHRRHPTILDVSVGVSCKTLTVPDPGRGVDR